MEATGKQRLMVVNLEILEAIHVIVKSAGRRGLFVRYYLSSGNGKGNNNIAVSTKEVIATPFPQWKQVFCLKCGVNIDSVNVVSELQKQCIRFELRERRGRIRVLGSTRRASKLVGWVEIPWRNILESPALSINGWFPLMTGISKGSQPQPSLHIAISVNLVESGSQPPQERETENETHDVEVMGGRNEMCRNFVNVNRRIRHLERDDCRCGGKFCRQGLEDGGIFAVVL